MKHPVIQLLVIVGACLAAPTQAASTAVHLTYHWHLHQPIYWPETNRFSPQTNRYQFAADSIWLKTTNGGNFYPGSTDKHPRNALVSGDGGEFDSVFDKADRVAAYQYRGKDSIDTIRTSHPDGGASVSYSGALQENIGSLGRANSYGYGSGWNSGYTTARGSSADYRTTSSHPRADMVGMTYHHAFGPLLPKSVLRKEIQIFKEIWWKSWGGNPNKSDHSKGFWPIEAAFSRHMIPVLVEEGYQWSIVANSHLARTCTNYLDVAIKGTSGWNIDPPNRADQLGPSVPANQWWSGQIDGRGGAFPAPFAYQAHRVKHVNPETGVESFITVVPMCDLLSYMNGFSPMGTGEIDAHIAPFNNPAQPSLVLLAHDGDNAWGGGYDYYMVSVKDLFRDAANNGYRPTTIQQFLTDHPAPAGDVVHVEDGAWVNAANDWGHPQFVNWLYPPTRPSSDPAYNGQDPRTWYDLETPGWTEDWRNWAVLIAGANYCETAEQITVSTGGSVQAYKIQEPVQTSGVNNNPNAAEQAWHFYLGGLDSGFMYYGDSLDDEVKQTLAVNRAASFASSVIGSGALDQTPPTVFKPQRFPWNPGGKGWGQLTGYQPVGFDGQPPYSADFHIWTHVFDVSGTTNVTLYVRADVDGVNPLGSHQNETYAGGSEVGAWVALPMNKRTVPTGNVTGNPNISFFLTPQAIADYYWAKVTGYTNVLLDYYVQATDSKGNTHKSDIQHVWVDSGSGSSSGGGNTNACDGRVCIAPAPAVQGNPVNIYYSPAGGPLAGAPQVYLHLGWNAWNPVVSPDAAMTLNAPSNRWEITVNAPANATQLDCVFNNGGSTWDNNSGADWHFAVTTNSSPQSPAQPTGLTATAVSSNQINLAWSAAYGATGYVVSRGGSPISSTALTSYSDTGLQPNTPYCYTVTATNAVGSSSPSSSACATTPSGTLTNYPPFVMDGAADFAGYRLSTNSPQLYAAVRGSKLYVACQSAANGSSNDHFLFVTDQLLGSATTAAPWAKSGLIAVSASKPYMAAEGANNYATWNNAPAGATLTKASSSSGVLEGTLDLTAAFGALPEVVYVAAAAYATADGGNLVGIAPAGSGPHLDPGEFLALPLIAFKDDNGEGLYDRLDPGLDFRIESTGAEGNGLRFSFACVPGRSYRVVYRESLTNSWSVLAGSTQTATGVQTTLNVTNTPGTPVRFYRVELLP
ncbi:MAG: hypothetical protein MUE94_10065 [Verrucomicrobia bacterium]|jgi:hypothetical protein|nr:hypothetical protein [Verrucomicrobiota bacterium]